MVNPVINSGGFFRLTTRFDFNYCYDDWSKQYLNLKGAVRGMAELTLEMAERAVKAAQAKARELGTPMTATVVDEAGRLVLSARGDGTGFLLLKLPVARRLRRRRLSARPRTWRNSENRRPLFGAMCLRS